MMCRLVLQDEGRAVLRSFPNKTQDNNQNCHISQVEPRNHRDSSIYIPSSRLHLHSLFLPYLTHRQHPALF